MDRLSRVVVGCAGLVALAGVARAEVAVLVANHDTSMYSEDGALSNGSGLFLFAGLTALSDERRALVSFDLSGIPQGSTVTSVSLKLHVSEARPGSGTPEFSVHRVLSAWGEGASDAGLPGGGGILAEAGDTTWTKRSYPDVMWNFAGGDFDGVASGTANAGDPETDCVFASTPGLVADVQSWLTTPNTNFGWILVGPGTNATARRFLSRESSVPANRPTLTVTYTPLQNVCPADLDNGSGNGTPDGGVDVNDLLYFLVQFEAGSESVDLDNGSGTGTPDGGVDINDLLYFLIRFEGGC